MRQRSGSPLPWIIKYTETAQKQLKSLDRAVAIRVLDYLDERVAPLQDARAIGKNLVGPRMGSYWRYRVGDIRVVCDIQDQTVTILVVEVGHRREIYR